ncbi:MAG: lysylphosphatidylglycerol synthase transmembrane domain-containing protein [Elusimicrobiota bacterium]|nr:lysylphosphatidylglycerol synthase transmembrane domain-containing protein [Elusimicrobiota bacterium]
MKKALSVGVGLAATGFFLWLGLRGVEFHKLGEALRAARWGWLLPMTAIVYADLLVRALRWRVLLSRARPGAPVGELFRLEAIGLAVNNVLFMRLGELARAVLAARRLGVSSPTALASVAIERALDVAALLTIFLLASAAAPGFVPAAVRQGAGLLLAAALGALVVLAAAETALAPEGALERLLRRWPRFHHFVEQLALGAAVLRSPAAAAQAAFLSLLLWTTDACLYWAGARALGLEALVDYPRAVLALSWAGASSALPAAPGAIGTFEAVVGDILARFGATASEAFAYAVVCHAVMYVLVTVTGLLLLWRVGVSLAGLQEDLSR